MLITKEVFIKNKLTDVNSLSVGSHQLVMVKCDICNTEKEIEWRRYIQNIQKINIFCCSRKCAVEKRKILLEKEYGVSNVFQLESIKEKSKKTNLERYGFEYASMNEDIKNKTIDTNIEKYGCKFSILSNESKMKSEKTMNEKYGVKHISKTDYFKDRINLFHKNLTDFEKEEIKRKRKDTNLEKYGVECNLQLNLTKDKIKNTNLEKYGFTSHMKNVDIKNKIKNQNLEKYGVEYPSQTESIKEKVKKGNLEKYGIEHVSQTKLVKDKIKDTRIKNGNPFNDLSFKNEWISNFIKRKEKYYLEKNFEIIDYKMDIQNGSEFCLKVDTCDHKFNIKYDLFRQRYKNDQIVCTICNEVDSLTSTCENSIFTFLNDNYKGEIRVSARDIINPKEIDIYLPELKIGIEFNGLYWHSEKFKNRKYHYEKYISCLERGIHLIQIWEDDWKYKNDIVKSILLNQIGLIRSKIYARKCEIVQLTNKESKKFLNENHIQGYVPSSITIGLKFNNEVVSLMTFSNRKINNSNRFELLRFCNKINTIVIGSANKLFNNFLENNIQSNIISYSDNSIFNGKMYEILNFKNRGNTSLNYYWVKGDKKYHRFNFNKKKLLKEGYSSDKTEKEIMYERGFFKVWGCGQTKWVYET